MKKKDTWDIGTMFQYVLVITSGIAIFFLLVFHVQIDFYFNVVGLVYELVGFAIMLIASKNKIRISQSDLKNDGIVEIDFISKRKSWELGIVLVITGLFFQLWALFQE